ncbi:MAG TPA: 3-phosphoshikimate 1-carboxyvinyltransferase, partial [Bacteroidota bacterium]|nr:3-phosphoshikimate 1-carboxyvinyltransferase [Bacteroidota bacterium]
TNRALMVAALADGLSTLVHPSLCGDTKLLISALHEFGVETKWKKNSIEVKGINGNIKVPSKKLFVGNAGTVMRFLTTFAGLANGETVLDGDEHMRCRPINDLLEALRGTGIKCASNNGFPPVKILGGNFSGGRIGLNASISSQFASSILLSAPYAKQDVYLHINGQISSLPYVDMSLHVMRTFGADVNTIDPFNYHVNHSQRYIGQKFNIEGDATAASYFLAAAAITQGQIVLHNLSPDSLQGDLRFINILNDMGCDIIKHEATIVARGGKLTGIEIDMNELPDCVPTLAIVAAFADGPTTINNVSQLRYKESDRLRSLTTELTKIGVKVELHKDGMTIHPQRLHEAVIETYNDHRIAMSFAVAGLCIDGLAIDNPACVEKSFPNFWGEFANLEKSA